MCAKINKKRKQEIFEESERLFNESRTILNSNLLPDEDLAFGCLDFFLKDAKFNDRRVRNFYRDRKLKQ